MKEESNDAYNDTDYSQYKCHLRFTITSHTCRFYALNFLETSSKRLEKGSVSGVNCLQGKDDDEHTSYTLILTLTLTHIHTDKFLFKAAKSRTAYSI